jgi:O-glycosyl hydrolase
VLAQNAIKCAHNSILLRKPVHYTRQSLENLGKLVHEILGDNVKLLAYDHNWDVPSYPLSVLDATTPGTFAGTAWHCYAGDMTSAMEQLHTAYPDVPQHITECTGSFPNDACDITKGSSHNCYVFSL